MSSIFLKSFIWNQMWDVAREIESTLQKVSSVFTDCIAEKKVVYLLSCLPTESWAMGRTRSVCWLGHISRSTPILVNFHVLHIDCHMYAANKINIQVCWHCFDFNWNCTIPHDIIVSVGGQNTAGGGMIPGTSPDLLSKVDIMSLCRYMYCIRYIMICVHRLWGL